MVSKRHLHCAVAIIVLAVVAGSTKAATLQEAIDQFETYTGAKLVFQRENLPQGKYHDMLPPLNDSQKLRAAEICLDEAKLYPQGYFGAVGLKAIGVFAACLSKKGDGFREYDRQLKGYRYFGVYNGQDALAAAFYSEGQLALTFHHEFFHHVDSTKDGVTEKWLLASDDALFQAAVSGLRPYPALNVSSEDLDALENACIGMILKDSVSAYAAKNPREDQAETARHMMSNLPNAIVQAVQRPGLAGSQRILHILREYEQAAPDGPGVDWFVDAALGRTQLAASQVEDVLERLGEFAERESSKMEGVRPSPSEARLILRRISRMDVGDLNSDQAAELVRVSSDVTKCLLLHRIQPSDQDRRFVVWGKEDSGGINWTLRRDVTLFVDDASRLKQIAQLDMDQSENVLQTQLSNLRLLARFYAYLGANWTITPGTQKVFELARDRIANSLATENDALSEELQQADLLELAWRITKEGRLAEKNDATKSQS